MLQHTTSQADGPSCNGAHGQISTTGPPAVGVSRWQLWHADFETRCDTQLGSLKESHMLAAHAPSRRPAKRTAPQLPV
jgi:hypothetical protein